MSDSRPADEAQRLLDVADLKAYDRVTEELLNAFVRVAGDLMGVPASGISIVGECDQSFLASRGLTPTSTPRDDAFCSYAILRPDEVMVVPDLAADPRFQDNPLVTANPAMRFYAGAPLRGSRGTAVGTLCVMDTTPRQMTPALLDRLRDLSLGVSAALTLRQAIREVHRAARTDALTGMLNRKAFDEMLDEPVVRDLGLLMIDLDGFKPINDTYGHAGGDRALTEVARRLAETVRTRDSVVRLGGDEFVVVMREVERPEACTGLAARIHAALADTFVLNGSIVPLRASIGCAAMPWHASTMRMLLERADAALYAAKRAGRGITRSASESAAGQGVGRVALEAWLQEAFAPGGRVPFHLVFQPIAELPTGQVRMAEALLRWRTDAGLSLRPADVLPVIEGMGYSAALDRWVVGEACRLVAAAPPPYPISVNVSASTFGLPGFDAEVNAILRRHGVPGTALVIEMTEGSLSGDPESAMANIRGLSALGVPVVLDDFGGGHGTLARLRGHAFDAIKIDRSLVTDCARDPQSRALIEAVADMAQALGVPAVAEGVENAAQLAVLAQCGVECAQGFLISHPIAWDRLEDAATAMPGRIRTALAEGGITAGAA